VVSRALSAVAKSSGPGAAKTAWACLSGMFAMAIQDGAVAVKQQVEPFGHGGVDDDGVADSLVRQVAERRLMFWRRL
jgi:hypothetical protein